MPDTISGVPFFRLSFDRDANPTAPHEADALRQYLADHGTDHLLVISHGWRNDTMEAQTIYDGLLASLRRRIDATAPLDVVAAGVYWPSAKFADKDLIPGGAASSGRDVPVDLLTRELETAEETASDDEIAHLRAARDLVPLLADSPSAQDEFADHLRALLPAGGLEDDAPPERLRQMRGRDLLDDLERPLPPSVSGRTGGAASVHGDDRGASGGAAGLGDLFRGARSGARKLLSMTTYYQMKKRAGTVGEEGLAPVLDRIAEAVPSVEIHLCGHSFGARLVTAAAAAADTARPASLTLLQAAFSHNAFSSDFGEGTPGGFRIVVDQSRIRGPIVISHTRNDSAVGRAYPLASRLGRQNANALGGPSDEYGGLGSNGAQHTAEAVGGTLGPQGQAYTFQAGRIHNLRADDYVSDHGDVMGPEVAQALLAAMRTA